MSFVLLSDFALCYTLVRREIQTEAAGPVCQECASKLSTGVYAGSDKYFDDKDGGGAGAAAAGAEGEMYPYVSFSISIDS